MRNLTIALAVLAAVGCLPISVALAQDVTGTWSGTLIGRQRDQELKEEFTLVLSQSGQEVTGFYSGKTVSGGRHGGRERTDVKAKGELSDGQLTLQIGPQGRIVATVTGDSMTGSFARGNNQPLRVSATRSK